MGHHSQVLQLDAGGPWPLLVAGAAAWQWTRVPTSLMGPMFHPLGTADRSPTGRQEYAHMSRERQDSSIPIPSPRESCCSARWSLDELLHRIRRKPPTARLDAELNSNDTSKAISLAGDWGSG